jgi:hypothetical protein
MKMSKFLAVAAVWAILPLWLEAMEFQYTGDPEKLRVTREFCSGEAANIINQGLITSSYTNALFSALMLERLREDNHFNGVKFNDTDINEINALSAFLWSKPSKYLDSAGHPMLGSMLASFKVRAKQQRAKDLFGKDDPANWNIPQEKEDPKRFYSLPH